MSNNFTSNFNAPFHQAPSIIGSEAYSPFRESGFSPKGNAGLPTWLQRTYTRYGVSASVGRTRVPCRFQKVRPLFIVSNATQFMTVRVQEMRNLLLWETSCDVETVPIHMLILRKKAFALALLLCILSLSAWLSVIFILYEYFLFIWHQIQPVNYFFIPLQTKRRLLYLKNQSVPRSKHFSSRL